MGSRQAWIFPVLSFVLLLSAFFISYCIAISRNDVAKLWPFISDTGALPPESCVFSQLVNMSAAFMMISLYLRHRQIMAYFRPLHDQRRIVISSRIFLFVGLFATFGLMMVANFQEQNVTGAHFFGAFSAFALGLVYGWYQAVISFLSPPELTPRWLARFRLGICIFGAIFFVGMYTVNIVGLSVPLDPSSVNNGTKDSSRPNLHRIGPDEPGYTALLMTTFSEWLLGGCLALFFLTFAFDLRGSKLRTIKLELRRFPKSIDSIRADIAPQFLHATDVKMQPAEILSEISIQRAAAKDELSQRSQNNNNNNNNNNNSRWRVPPRTYDEVSIGNDNNDEYALRDNSVVIDAYSNSRDYNNDQSRNSIHSNYARKF